MKKLLITLAIIILLGFGLLLILSSNEETSEQETTTENSQEEILLGFTDFPYALTSEAYQETFETIFDEGNIVLMHFDEGIPWQQALDNNYQDSYLLQFQQKANAIPNSKKVFLAITPISFERDSIALDVETAQKTYTDFSDPNLQKAYKNHALKMIETFDPDYFAYAIEANMFAQKNPEQWPAFVSFSEEIYTTIKTQHPNLPTFITIQAESFHQNPQEQTTLLKQITPYTDIIAVSTYPFTIHENPNTIPQNYFSQISDLETTKPFAISETSWPAETISNPYPTTISGSEQAQADYLSRLFEESEKRETEFIIWFFPRDFDQYWSSDLSTNELAPTLRLWKDTGLRDGDGKARLAHNVWMEEIEK